MLKISLMVLEPGWILKEYVPVFREDAGDVQLIEPTLAALKGGVVAYEFLNSHEGEHSLLGRTFKIILRAGVFWPLRIAFMPVHLLILKRLWVMH